MRNLFEKRARDYNSDDEDEEEEKENTAEEAAPNYTRRGGGGDISSEGSDGSEGEQEGGDEIQSGVMKFTEGVRAFRLAFKNIIKKNVANDSLGPVLSGHKQLIAKKLAEEEAERKVRGEAKKEKHLVAEKGHVKPANYLDSHEKFLIGIATKGVVKLFNAVNKAQKAQKGLDPSRSKDAKASSDQTVPGHCSVSDFIVMHPASDKETEERSLLFRARKDIIACTRLFQQGVSKACACCLGMPALSTRQQKSPWSFWGNTSSDPNNDEGPAWAPLRDNYMLTNPKLKDWDKMADSAIVDDVGRMSEDSGSDDD
ncbi:hypothetical protein F3Y22_tig00117034pilonHSYRG00049 [Hibiscus syriacus]|uniref:RRP15-like protein n=1 Tax=Hibiscus syriacus TaxID=106335 RepID=A0A6A2XLU0_HIBSY|nr:hypothetical protein F3Y22_tig00117034pilonHSYRG00049 [Hibiscus syriacus]